MLLLGPQLGAKLAQNFAQRILKGLGSSNPPLSANESVVLPLQYGVSTKSPRDAAVVRLMRTGERESGTRFGEFLGFVSRRRKAGSLHGSSQIRSSIAFLKWGRSRL